MKEDRPHETGLPMCGVALAVPVTMLATGVDNGLFTRAEDGTWTQLSLPPGTPLAIRALAVHKDAVTGVDELFIGAGLPDNTTPGAIYTGVYDPALPGRVRIAPAAEFTGFLNRVMAFTEVDGKLLFAAKPDLYERTDGVMPSWSVVASAPPMPPSVSNSGLRGLTVIGASSPVVVGGLEGDDGPILRFNPSNGFSPPSTDLNIGNLLQTLWGTGQNQYIISAYNNMPTITDPQTGNPVNLIGLQAHNPSRMMSAWYLVRDASGHYTLHGVPALTSLSPLGLVAVRTILVSPFAADMGQVLYLGGYDANFKPAHNTPWLYRVGLQTAMTAP